jgi:hypothetical protein
MYQRTARTLVAATAAGAAMAALGLTGAAAAATTSAASGIPTIYTNAVAGYLDGGGYGPDFRFVAATVEMAACQPTHNIPERADNANARVGLLGTGLSATVTATCGGGKGTVTYGDGSTHGTFKLSPRVGDALRLSVYWDAASQNDQFAVTDTTSGASQTVTVPAHEPHVYWAAELESVIKNSGIAHRPTLTQRLWDFRFCNVTTTTGVHSGITGPWATQKMRDWPHPSDAFGSVMYPSGTATGHQFSTNLVSRY